MLYWVFKFYAAWLPVIAKLSVLRNHAECYLTTVSAGCSLYFSSWVQVVAYIEACRIGAWSASFLGL